MSSSKLQRIRFYSRSLYGFAEFFHFVPFRYNFRQNGPSLVVPLENLTWYAVYARFSCVTVTCFILSLYVSIIFGDVTKFEGLIIGGFICVFSIAIMGSWTFLIRRSRMNLISLMNAVLEDWYNSSHVQTVTYEVIHIFMTLCGVVYPFVYLPSFIFILIYFPSLADSVIRGSNWLTFAMDFANPETANVVSWTFQICFFGIIATALSHSVVNLCIVVLWLCTYHISTVQSLQRALGIEPRW